MSDFYDEADERHVRGAATPAAQTAPKRGPGRPPKIPRTVPTVTVDATEPGDDHAAELRDIVGQGIAVVREEMRVLTIPPISPENADRVRALATWANAERGVLVRADANVSRRRATLATVEKDIAALTPDERAHLLNKLGAGGESRSVLS